MKTTNKFAGVGVLTAIAASLCCITPVLALISGVGGMASAFSWMEPFRPYLIGITVLVLAFAWYQKLKPRTAEEIQCDCETEEKPPFIQTKKFLGIASVLAFLMMAFPYYSNVFYPDNQKQPTTVDATGLITLDLKVEGMTCESCNLHVAHAAQELNGVTKAEADYKTGTAEIKFDPSKTSEDEIVQSINATGYQVAGKEVK
ncbi:mercuric transport protein MerTP [Prolixibacter sp. NT017]|uniref:mercuric transport protein MerTP n=1 Tax=Prolixibacter sp. NT017 TaxID=2652390 RepID=UPI001287B4A7|nr:mercuric transport protein MerTP [Prolixibacter sp. NT017]GET24407.1 hypothetical protein NT017_07360 [Prolixibacter sp. NT017]